MATQFKRTTKIEYKILEVVNPMDHTIAKNSDVITITCKFDFEIKIQLLDTNGNIFRG